MSILTKEDAINFLKLQHGIPLNTEVSITDDLYNAMVQYGEANIYVKTLPLTYRQIIVGGSYAGQFENKTGNVEAEYNASAGFAYDSVNNLQFLTQAQGNVEFESVNDDVAVAYSTDNGVGITAEVFESEGIGYEVEGTLTTYKNGVAETAVKAEALIGDVAVTKAVQEINGINTRIGMEANISVGIGKAIKSLAELITGSNVQQIIPDLNVKVKDITDPNAILFDVDESIYGGFNPGYYSVTEGSRDTQNTYNILMEYHPTLQVTFQEFEQVVVDRVENQGLSMWEARGTAVLDIFGGQDALPETDHLGQSTILYILQKHNELGGTDPYNIDDYADVYADDLIAGEYGDTDLVSMTADDVLLELSGAIEESRVDGKISESTKNLKVIVEREEGSSDVSTISVGEAKVKVFQTEFADAQVNGVVVSQNTTTETNADGSIFNVATTVILDGESYYTITEKDHDGQSPAPEDGVTKRTQSIKTDLDGNIVGQDTGEYFAKGDLLYETEVYQLENGNTHIRQNIARADGNGGHTEFEDGPLYVVPSAELLAQFQFAGTTLGGLLGSHLADDSIAQQILYSAALKTIGEHFGTFGAFLATDSDFLAAVDTLTGADLNVGNGGSQAITPDMQDAFLKHLTSATISTASGLIVNEVGEALGIDGTVGGEVFNVAAGAVTTGVATDALGLIFDGLDAGDFAGIASGAFDFSKEIFDPRFVDSDFIGPIDPNLAPPNTTVGEVVGLEIANALAAYAGSRLAGELIEPESEAAALFGAAGSAFAGAIASGAILAGNSVATAFASIGWAGGPIGAAVGAFVGTVIGTFFGNLFGDEEIPSAWAYAHYSYDDNEYVLGASWSSGGGDVDVSRNMAQQVVDGVNSIIAATHGIHRLGAAAPKIQIGYEGNDFKISVNNGHIKTFGNAADAVMHAATKILTGFDLVGGHAVVMRAWHNTDAESIYELKEDLEVAEAFQLYLADPASILALMMNDPESALAQSWAAILQRSAELELHLPHEKDLDGGWGEVLNAQGVDPSLIPNIDGDALVLTDPITGDETIIHHVIGPGYEIVRIEGTDGNDIIEVIVDGPSITYVDGQAGDDVIEGSDQSDILVGNAGDDTINGNDGNDWLHGGQGDDTLDGGAGDDLVVGGPNNDYLIGGADSDQIYGNGGTDIMIGMGGWDFLYGGDGDDTLYGDNELDASDRLYGQAGDDTFVVSTRAEIWGGRGDDHVVIESGRGGNYIYISRGEGHDIITSAGTELANALIFDQTIGGNELFFQQNGDDLSILVLGEKQSVTIEDYFLGNAAVEIRAYSIHYVADNYNSHGFQTINALTAIHGGLTIQPTGEYNYIDDSTLANGFYNWGNYWRQIDSTNPGHVIEQGTAGSDTLTTNNFTYRARFGDSGDDIVKSTQLSASIGEYLYGDSGDDEIWAGRGDDTLVGGLGNDFLRGAKHNDRLYGGYGDDDLYGDSEDDQLYGGQGDDYLEGSNGDDYLDGGDNDDYLIDDFGNNIFHGGDGNDSINSVSTGSQLVYAGFGDDTVTITDGTNTIHGEDGDDTIISGLGDDFISGGSGDDDISSGLGDDSISGGSGDDTFRYIGGADQIFEDTGVDRIVFDPVWLSTDVLITGNTLTFSSSTIDFITFNNIDLIEYFDFDDATNLTINDLPFIRDDVFVATDNADNFFGNLGTDIVDYRGSGAAVSVDLAISVFSGGFAEGDMLTSIENVIGSVYDDTLAGDAHDNALYGEHGDDTLNGGGGADTLDGGNGVDTADYSGSVDAVTIDLEAGTGARGDAEGDTLISIENIIGSNDTSVRDYLYGNDLANVLMGMSGKDTLQGGGGADIIDGGSYWDYASYTRSSEAVQINLETGIHTGGDAEGDTLISIEALRGSDYDDTFIGSSVGDYIRGNDGNDTIHGGDGIDYLLGEDDDDLLYGQDGDDVLEGDSGDDTLSGGNGADTLEGGSGADTFILDATIFNDVDEVTDFDTSEGDTLLIDLQLTSNLLAGSITDILRITNDGTHSYLSIDISGGGDSFVQVVQISDNTELNDVTQLLADGNIQFASHLLDYSVAALSFAGSDFTSYTNQDDLNTVFAVTGSTELHLAGNNWKVLDFDYTVTENTYIQLEYQTVVEGEIQGLVFLPDDRNPSGSSTDHNPSEIIRLDGYQLISTGQDALYNDAVGGWQTITVKLSDYNAVGTVIDNLVFVNDDDDDETGDALFRNIRVYEEGTIGNDTLNGTFYNETLIGQDGNDTLYGGVGNDHLYGGDGDDILYGDEGSDYLYGNAGADTFVFESSTAFTSSNTIYDFDTSEGDKLDIADVLIGYDPLTDAISDFIQITDSGSNSVVEVDVDGGADNFVQIVTLMDMNGLTDESLLETNGNLIAV